jgi:ribosomal protein S27E
MSDGDTTNRPGKRYTCSQCGTELMCTKGGAGRVACHGAFMELVSTKPLPSSD